MRPITRIVSALHRDDALIVVCVVLFYVFLFLFFIFPPASLMDNPASYRSTIGN